MGERHVDTVRARLSLLRVLLPEPRAADLLVQGLLHLDRREQHRLVVHHEVVELDRVKVFVPDLVLRNLRTRTGWNKTCGWRR